jgi:hypothetical protein
MSVGARIRGAFSACRRRRRPRRPRCKTARRPAQIAIPRRTSCPQHSRSAAFQLASRGVASSTASAGRWLHGLLRRPCLLTAVAARLGRASAASGHGRGYQANRGTEGHSPPAAKQGPPVGRPLTFKSPAAGLSLCADTGTLAFTPPVATVRTLALTDAGRRRARQVVRLLPPTSARQRARRRTIGFMLRATGGWRVLGRQSRVELDR